MSVSIPTSLCGSQVNDYLGSLPAAYQTVVRSLDLGQRELQEFPDLGPFLRLRSLWLNNNNLTSVGFLPPSLRQLDLSWNQLGEFSSLDLPKTLTELTFVFFFDFTDSG